MVFPDVRMLFTPTSQGVPLSQLCDHRSSIHSLWPVARFNCFSSRYTSNNSALLAKCRMLNKICSSYPEHVSIFTLASMLGDIRIFSRPRSRSPCSCLVLPLHKGLEFSKLCRDLMRDAELWHAFGFGHFRSSICWRLTNSSLSEWIQQGCKHNSSCFSLRRAG